MSIKKLLLSSLSRVRMRGNGALLTVIAISVGVSMVTALWAQMDGVAATFSRSLGALGTRDIVLSAQGRNLLTDIDLAKLYEAEGVSNVLSISSASLRISEFDSSVLILGLSPSDLEGFLSHLRILEGGMYPPMPVPLVLLGNRLAYNDSGEVRYRLGEPVLGQVAEKPIRLTVVGILELYGKMPMIDPDLTVFASASYVKEQLGAKGYSLLIVSVADADTVDQVTEYIRSIFESRVSVSSIKQLADTQYRIMAHLQLLSIAFSGIAFTAAGFGAFYILSSPTGNGSSSTVTAGEPHVGIRVFPWTYLLEGGIVASLGTCLGAVLGIVLAYMLPPILRSTWSWMLTGSQFPPGFLMDYRPELGLAGIGVGFTVSMLVGLISSACAARMTYMHRPIEA